MSVKAITWAWRQPLPATEKLVLLALADHSNDEDYRAWPSLTHLAEKCGLHRRSVARLLGNLEAAGVISRMNRGIQTTVYTLNIDSDTAPLVAKSHYRHSATSGSLPSDTVSGGSDRRSLRVVAQRHTEPSIEPSKKRKGAPASMKRFVPPTVEEVQAYCRERGNDISPEAFIDYYTSNGWMVGKNKMRDWKAAVRTWERKQKEFSANPKTGDLMQGAV